MKPARQLFPVMTLLISLFLGAGCASVAEDFAHKASALRMNREVLLGAGFQHVLFSKAGTPSETLHIYIDGDGSPWIAGRPADDPTPRNSLMLRLMDADKSPAVYVGRPCYHGMHSQPICSSRYWLGERYAEPVVNSLRAVIKQLLNRGNYQKVALFGHSGGGTLAVLLAARMPETRVVVTIAANLDLEAWGRYTENHDLTGSLNPAALSPLTPSVLQYHFGGGKDLIVPPALMATAAERLGSRLRVIDGYDHVCCWERLWANMLDDLAAAI